jgi:hypothetical protein
MVWNWHMSESSGFKEAEMDYKASAPYEGYEWMSTRPLPVGEAKPIFKARASLEKFECLHCPPIGTSPVIDKAWQSIVSKFVSSEQVQFFPIRLIAKGGQTDKFSWLVPLVETEIIDVKKSKIRRQSRALDGSLLIWDVDEFVYLPDCLQGLHMARDVHLSGHIVISDELRDELAATGEDTMFYREEDIPTLFGKNSIFPELNQC